MEASMKAILCVLMVFCLIDSADAAGASGSARGDVDAGATKAAVCGGCHGASGQSVNPLWPNLAGQHVEYLDKQIRAFRDGKRLDPTMRPFVATLSDGDIADIAAFFAAQRVCR